MQKSSRSFCAYSKLSIENNKKHVRTLCSATSLCWRAVLKLVSNIPDYGWLHDPIAQKLMELLLHIDDIEDDFHEKRTEIQDILLVDGDQWA